MGRFELADYGAISGSGNDSGAKADERGVQARDVKMQALSFLATDDQERALSLVRVATNQLHYYNHDARRAEVATWEDELDLSDRPALLVIMMQVASIMKKAG